MADLTLSPSDVQKLSPAARRELLGLFRLDPDEAVMPASVTGATDEFDYEGVVDLSPQEVAKFLEGVHPQTEAGLKVFADHGPAVDARRLSEVGIENFAHFQGRVTKRTRTVTGQKGVYLLAWDEWEFDDDGNYVSGRYAVTPMTYHSLRRHFGLA